MSERAKKTTNAKPKSNGTRKRPQTSAPRSGKPKPRRVKDQARALAVAVIADILQDGRSLDDAFDRRASADHLRDMESRDRAFARLIIMTVLRHRGELAEIINRFVQKPLPEKSGKLWPILLSAAAQLVLLETPAHAAINVAVDQCREDRRTAHFDKLTNAVLRRVSEQGAEIRATLDGATLNVPEWLLKRWQQAYGNKVASEIAAACLKLAPLDLSVKGDPKPWAEKLGGDVLPTGSVRLPPGGRVDALEGFEQGAWWVQDAAAALPAKLLGNVAGLRVADLCCAPGGKTAELAAAGAIVTAVDISDARLKRVHENLARLKLEANVIAADIADWTPDQLFDAILLDAPCTATGTIRRHPDILHLKRESDIADLATVQARLLNRAITFVTPGGFVVFCTCSLEPEEGPAHIAQLLEKRSDVERVAITSGEFGIEADWLTGDGDLRTLPSHGVDGFYAARLRRLPDPNAAS